MSCTLILCGPKKLCNSRPYCIKSLYCFGFALLFFTIVIKIPTNVSTKEISKNMLQEEVISSIIANLKLQKIYICKYEKCFAKVRFEMKSTTQWVGYFETISGHFFWQLYQYISWNWGSDCLFDVPNIFKSLFDQKLWHKTQFLSFLFFSIL